MHEPKIIKKVNKIFDGELALVEAHIAQRIAEYHLNRCDDVQVAEGLARVYKEISNSFAVKVIALEAKKP